MAFPIAGRTFFPTVNFRFFDRNAPADKPTGRLRIANLSGSDPTMKRPKVPCRSIGQVVSALAMAVTSCAVSAWAVDHMPWVPDIPTAQRIATSRNQLLLLHFTSDQCPPCRRLEQNVFSQPTIGHSVGEDFVPVRINVGEQPKIAEQFGVTSWPTDVLVTPQGQVLHRMISPQDGNQYTQILRQVAWHHRQHVDGASLAMYQPSSEPSGSASFPSTTGSSPFASIDSKTGVTAPVGVTATAADPLARTSWNRPGVETPGVSNPSGIPSTAAPPVAGTPAAGVAVAMNPYAASSPQATLAAAPSMPTPPAAGSASMSPPLYQSAVPVAGQAPPASVSTVSAEVSAPLATAPRPATTAASPVPPAASPATLNPVNATSYAPAVSSDVIGMEGFCPVTVMDENRWVAGDRRFGARHRGRLYLFQTAAAQDRFLRNPERYSPALGGLDPVSLAERGQQQDGKRDHGVRYNDRMYLFGSEENLERFSKAPEAFAAFVQRALSGG